MSNHVIQVRVMGGEHDSEVTFIPYIKLFPFGQGISFNVKFNQRQYPIQLAFAMTINKSQGQSLKHIRIDLYLPVFAYGQLYIALSYTTSQLYIKMLLPESEENMETTNVIEKTMLID
jgi:hypothetical protein